MSLRVLLGVVFLGGGLLPAQIFSSFATTATPLTVTCTVPGLPPLVGTTPAGTPAGAVWMSPVNWTANGSASANIDGQWIANEKLVQLFLAEHGSASLQAVTTVSAHDYLMTLQATVPTPVLLTIEWIIDVEPGQQMPLAQVDVGDDGVFDFVGVANGQTMTVPLTIGSTPFHLRTRTALTASGGNIQTYLSCSVTPDFGATATTVGVGTGCADLLSVYTTFEHELVLAGINFPALNAVNIMVVGWGLAPAPIPLGSCLLRASPDVVLLTGDGRVRVDLQTVPPLTTFYAQSVAYTLSSGSLIATPTKLVHVP
jgi:hypothetical protein